MFHSRFCLSPKLTLSFLVLSLFILVGNTGHTLNLISEETELAMGRQADRQISAQYGIYQDKILQLYVNEIGQKLVNQLSDPVFPRYFFKIVDSPDINAFALPGGYIYVTRGILALLNSEAELAGVLGHEIGHVIFHHGAKHITRSIGAKILSLGGAAIASSKNAGNWLRVSSELFNQVNLGYGREAELESDAHGILNAYNAGYHPNNMARFLRSLRRKEIMSGQAYHSFRATHPDTKERIIRAGTMEATLIRRGKPVSEKRENFLLHLKGLSYGGKRHVRDRIRGYKPMHVDIYEIKVGDTFESIAGPFIESRPLEIATMNGMKYTETLLPGNLLKIVRKGKYEDNQRLKLNPDTP